MGGNGKCKYAVSMAEQQSAIAAGEASTEAAKVVKTAQAAVKNITQTRIAYLVRQHYAALVIQTAFRGYLVSNYTDLCLFIHFWMHHMFFDFMF